MESWIKSVWVKRLLPFILIAAGWGAYSWWAKRAEASTAIQEHRYALATARAWVASATFRDDPKRYLAYRDSILAADNLSVEKMQAMETRYSQDPEAALRFSAVVNQLVDSLVAIENAKRKIQIDSTEHE